MGDLAVDSAVERVADDRFRARLSPDWAIWGPNGGYVLSVALRAAGAASSLGRPVSLSAHMLSVAHFDAVDLDVVTLRRGRRSESLRVTMRQDDRDICEAMVWMAGDADGPTSDWAVAPAVPAPLDVPTFAERLVESGEDPPQSGFWANLEPRYIDWVPADAWATARPLDPTYHAWMRYRPRATFDDPVVDACRSLLLLDLFGWPAVSRGLPPELDGDWIAPNMDLAVSFHQFDPTSEFLHVDGRGPIATGGFASATGSIWSEGGQLLATGLQSMMFRPARR